VFVIYCLSLDKFLLDKKEPSHRHQHDGKLGPAYKGNIISSPNYETMLYKTTNENQQQLLVLTRHLLSPKLDKNLQSSEDVSFY